MNILILNWKDIKNPEVGGAELIAFEFAKKLVKDNHVVTFFSRDFPKALPEETIDGVHIIRKGNKFTVYLHAFFYYMSLRLKPDKVIDMINTIAWQTPLYIPRKKRIAYLNQLAKEVWFYEFRFPFSIMGYIFEKIQYLFYRNTKFLCYSASTRNDLSVYGIPKRNISLFPLGVDHSRYKPMGKKSSDPLFLFVARLVKMKRANLCIQAIKKVCMEYPNVKLAIIGNGPDEKQLMKLRKTLHVEKNVFFVNKDNFFVNSSKKDIKVKWMQKAWGLLLPSVKEGWGMVVTEAAACGTPAIVSDVSGLRDSVLRNKTGIIVSSHPLPGEIAEAMIRLIKEKKLFSQMGKESIRWSNHFDWDKSYKQFSELLHTK